MEKNDIKIFELFHSELKDDIWSKFFFISLCGNIWYYIEEDTIFSFPNIKNIGEMLSRYRRDNFFKDDVVMDYYIFMSGNKHDWGYISDKIYNSVNFEKFLVLSDNDKNREYIMSVSRDNKIKEIIK